MSGFSFCHRALHTATLLYAASLLGACVEEGTQSQSAELSAATTVSFQQGAAPTSGYAGSIDATLNQSRPTQNAGSATTLLVDGDDGAGTDKSFLLRWDVTSIPDGSVVQSASITFYVTNVSANTYPIYAVRRPWTESGATWSKATSSVNWATAGAAGATDRGAAVAQITAPTTGARTVSLDAAGVALVQDWVDGTAANHGFLLASATNADGLDVASSEASTVSRRPRLTLTYGSPGSEPDAGAGGGSDDPVLVGAGDIADCNTGWDEQTANLLDGIPGTIFLAGDNVYESGTLTEYNNCFGPSWGRHKSRMRPAPGNHEYQTSGASGYYGYFGAAAGDPAKGYYSYDEGSWHVVVLNSNCAAVGGCSAGSAQEQWLRQDLAASTASCTLAYWHHPLFSSGQHGNNAAVRPLWKALQDDGAELVIAGHDHHYERFVAQDSNGVASASGIVGFVVGTGGRGLYRFPGSAQANTVVRNDATYGVLRLVLHEGSADFEFIPTAGQTFTDAGTIICH